MLLKFKKLGRYFDGFILPFTNPNSMKPHIIANTMVDVDFQALKDEGFDYVVFDKDNTLTDHDVDVIENEEISKKLTTVIEIFGKDNVAIFTNNLEVKEVDNCPLEVIHGTIKKPHAGPTVTIFFNDRFQKLESFCSTFFSGKKCIFVGDRLLTDVAQAHNLGGLGIWVKPWDLEHEQKSLKMARAYEYTIWKYFMGWATTTYNGKDFSQYSSNNPFKNN